jgi:GAF domain-containing protein
MTHGALHPIPFDEQARLEALASMSIINTPPEQALDVMVDFAAHLFNVPIALVSLIGKDKQVFKARVGLDICETSREVSFCSHAITQRNEVFVVPDARKDPRFAENPLVTGSPFIRFYAGAPLIGFARQPVGTLCIIDRKPRPGLSDHEKLTLTKLARMVILRMKSREIIDAARAGGSAAAG